MESLVLEGLVEAIIFKSEDTGYTVAKITANKELITIVGVMPLLQEGQQIEVKGKFIQHKQFGRQFSVEEYKEVSLGMYWIDVFFCAFFWDKQYTTLPYFDITKNFIELLNANIII